MATDKQLWVLTGGNGSGKSTFYKTQLKPLGLPFINADIIAKELHPEAPESHSYDAAKIAAHMRFELLAVNAAVNPLIFAAEYLPIKKQLICQYFIISR